jgi:hypothetical protein
MEVLGYEQACLISLCLLWLEQASCVRTACAAECAADVEQAAVGGWWTIFVVASLTTFRAGRPDKIVLGTALFGWIQF